jgi:hypothetical protein
MPSSLRKATACESGSDMSATSTLAPVASLRPAPRTWLTARWTTRANPSVGWARSRSSSGTTATSFSR